MTGAIISAIYRKQKNDTTFIQYLVSGSYFFIEPDIAITAYSNLCEKRSKPGEVYAENYFYLPNDVNCIRIEDEWLKEFPEKNITEIHFPEPVTESFFDISEEELETDTMILCEGFKEALILYIKDREDMDYLILEKSEFKNLQLLKQPTEIRSIVRDDSIYTDLLSIEKSDVIYTNCYPLFSMIGGPILNYITGEVMGVISHLPYSTSDSNAGIRGVKLEISKSSSSF